MSFRKAVVLGVACGAGLAALTILTVWSSHGLNAAAVIVIALLWGVTGAISGAAFYQEQSKKASD